MEVMIWSSLGRILPWISDKLGYFLTIRNVIINDSLKKFAGTLACDILHRRIQFDVSTFQNLLQTVYFQAAFLSQSFTVTSNFSQFPLFPAWDIASLQQTRRSKSAIHSASFTSVLHPGNAFMRAAFRMMTFRSINSNRLYSGFQNTPVLSMAIIYSLIM